MKKISDQLYVDPQLPADRFDLSGQIEGAQVRELQKAVAAASGPVLARCRTARVPRIPAARGSTGAWPRTSASGLGFDLSGAVKWLEAGGC